MPLLPTSNTGRIQYHVQKYIRTVQSCTVQKVPARYVTISSKLLSQRPLVFPQPPTHLFKIARYPIPAPLSTRHSEMALDPAVYSTVPYVRSTTDCTVQYCRIPLQCLLLCRPGASVPWQELQFSRQVHPPLTPPPYHSVAPRLQKGATFVQLDKGT